MILVNTDYISGKELEMLGWNVIVVWECELKNNMESTLSALVCMIRGRK